MSGRRTRTGSARAVSGRASFARTVPLGLLAAVFTAFVAYGSAARADGTTSEPSAETPSAPSPETPSVPSAGGAAEPPAGEPQPILPSIEVLVGGVPLVVEIASSGEQRYNGLSFRESLGEDAGMLFVYPRSRPLTFTMRNTLLPLSIAFIGDDLVVQEIIDMDVGPGQLFPSTGPARYALEVNQGWFERNGIGPGALVAMP